MISINIDKTIYIIYYAHSTVNPIWCIRNGLSELTDNLKILNKIKKVKLSFKQC